MAALLIETGSHTTIPLPGRVHVKQWLRLAELIQSLIDENGGFGAVRIELRGGSIHHVSKEVSELFSPEHLR